MEEPERNPSIMYLLRLLEGRWLLLLRRYCGFPIIPQSSWLDDLVDTRDKGEMEVQKWERQKHKWRETMLFHRSHKHVINMSSDLIVRNCLNNNFLGKPGSIIQRENFQTSSPNPKPQMPIHIKWRTKKLQIIEGYLLQLLKERRLLLLRSFPSLNHTDYLIWWTSETKGDIKVAVNGKERTSAKRTHAIPLLLSWTCLQI